MESESLLPCYQKPVTGLQPETDEATLRLPTLLLKIYLNIILPLTIRSSK